MAPLDLRRLNVSQHPARHVTELVVRLARDVKNQHVGWQLLIPVHFYDVTDFQLFPVLTLEHLSFLGEHELVDRLSVDFF